VDNLTHVIELPLHFRFGAVKGLLTQIDRVCQNTAALLDLLRVRPFLQFNSLGFQKAAQVSKEFVFINLVHK